MGFGDEFLNGDESGIGSKNCEILLNENEQKDFQFVFIARNFLEKCSPHSARFPTFMTGAQLPISRLMKTKEIEKHPRKLRDDGKECWRVRDEKLLEII